MGRSEFWQLFNSVIADRLEALEQLAALRAALELATTRLEILTDRLEGCHAETGRHELMSEAHMFCAEARAALSQPEPR